MVRRQLARRVGSRVVGQAARPASGAAGGLARTTGKAVETATRAGKSPVPGGRGALAPDPEYRRDIVTPRGKLGGPPPKARDVATPIAQSTVRER